MVLKQKQTNFFVLEASKKIIPNKAFIDRLPLPKSLNRRASAIFALTDMQHARG